MRRRGLVQPGLNGAALKRRFAHRVARHGKPDQAYVRSGFLFVTIEVWLRLERLFVNALAALVSFDGSWRSVLVCCFRLSAEVEEFKVGVTFECPPCSIYL